MSRITEAALKVLINEHYKRVTIKPEKGNRSAKVNYHHQLKAMEEIKTTLSLLGIPFRTFGPTSIMSMRGGLSDSDPISRIPPNAAIAKAIEDYEKMLFAGKTNLINKYLEI